MKRTLLTISALFTGLVPSSFGDITLSTTAPNTDVLFSTSLGAIDTALFPLLNSAPAPIAGNANHARGQAFSLGDGTGIAFEISAITFQKNIAATFANDSLTLRIFQGSEAAWTAGTGHLATDSDFYKGTTVTPLHEEVFTVNGAIADNEFITLELDTPLIVNENADFGFFLTYDPSAGTSPDRIRHLEATEGGRLSITTGSHGTSSRSMNCIIQGLPVAGTSGTFTTSSTAPTTDIIASSTTGATDTALFDENANANHARGQLFMLPNGSGTEYEINALTIRKSTAQTFANDTLTLRFFEGTQAQWDSGTGHSTANDGDDYYVDTSVTPLRTQVFTLDGIIADNDFVTFQLDSPLIVNEDSDFGFFMTYEQSNAANPDRFRHREHTTGGGRTSIDTTNHSTSPDRQIHYYLQGTPTGTATASLTLGSPFQNRMILQRDKPVNVWGTTDPASTVQVVINGHTVTGTADSEGNWEVELPASTAGGPHTLNVTSTGVDGTASTTINDVLFGDVWFCFGQSNMRWRFSNLPGSVTWDDFYRTEIAANDNIRCLSVVENGSLVEEETTGMTWLANSSVANWTVVGSVFAHQLNAATNVPVGIIYCAYGSSSIEGWLPASLGDELPHFEEMLEHYQSISEFRSGQLVATRVTDGRIPGNFTTNEAAIASISATNLAAGSNSDIFMRTRPNVLYNRRVHPLRKFGLSGFIWYQGEANASIIDSAQYQFTLPRMVEEYRERFDQGDLPFLGVQLPSFNQTSWPWFREAQDSLLTIPNAHVAITIDTGETNNIHPSDKEEIGVRLSLLAREHVLGQSIESDSPRYASHSINGDEVTLTFDHASGLSTGSRAAPAGFEVAGTDQNFHAATSANISGNTITVSSSAEPAPVAVRYAWTATTHTFVNVINDAPQPNGASGGPLGQGLPLAPFRTDDWPLPGLAAQVPVGNDDSYSVPRDQSLSIPVSGVLDNDFDLNLDTLEPTLGVTTTNGTLTLQADGSFTYIPEEGFAGEDFFTYQASETAGGLSSTTATVSITVEGTPSSYYTWRNTIAWSPGDDETTGGDPDGDGVPNLLEFALGMNPLQQDLSGLPSLTPSPSGADFDFNNAQPGITYEVLLSTDLVTWSDPAFATLDNTGTTPVALPSSEEVEGRLFVRLRVSETE